MRVFSTDHKVIGLQYAVTSLLFLLLGFALILILRWHLAWPTQPIPLVGLWLGSANTAGGVLLPEFYTQLGAMHGTIMVFLAVVPLAVGAFGNYLVPLMIGAPDMAFPRLNMLSYWLYLAGGLVMIAGFFLPGGAANSGWTSYPPLAVIATSGQTAWLVGMLILIVSSLLASINIIVTILQLRAPGLTMMRLPFFVWAQLVTSFLLLLAFPPLQAAVDPAVDGSARGHELLPADRPGGFRPAVAGQRRRQPDPLAAPVLVPRASRGLRPDPSGARHRRRSDREHHAQAALGLSGAWSARRCSWRSCRLSSGRTTCS